MHPSARAHFERVAKYCHPGWVTVEIGSFDVNGNLRDLFDGSASDSLTSSDPRHTYYGVDMRLGPNVDIVATGHALPFAARTFDAVISSSMLEHDSRPWVSAAEMIRILKPGGLIGICVPGFMFPRHEYPDDFWRFSASALRVLFPDEAFESLVLEEADEEFGPDVRYIGRKR